MEAQIGLSSTMSYELREALLIYRSDRKNSSRRDDPAVPTFVTKHAVQLNTAGTPSLGPGAVLDKSDLDTLIKGLQGSIPVELLTPNVLVRTHDSIVWWAPAAIRPMFYVKDKSAELDQLSGKRFPQPALLFKASVGSFSVRALASNERPSLKTPLYRAPYWNVYETGAVCLGSTKVPRQANSESLPRWEASFFESEFCHANGSSKLTEHPDGFVGLWKSIIGKKAFPVEHLADAKETLSKFIGNK
jgi:PRTRC genetic system protein B